MAYASDRSTTVKLEASPSLLWNNCAASPNLTVFAHKDSVYLLDSRAIESRAGSSLDKLLVRDPLSHITSGEPLGQGWGGGGRLQRDGVPPSCSPNRACSDVVWAGGTAGAGGDVARMVQRVG